MTNYMKTFLFSALNIALSLTLISCGGGGGGSSSDGPNYMGSNAFATFIADSMAGLEGVLEANSVSGDASGVSYTMTLVGYSFCQPDDLYANPTIPAPEGETIFGCTNDVSASISTGSTQATLTLSIPVLFTSADIDWDYSPFSGSFKAYVILYNANIEVVFNVSDAGNGTKKIDSVYSVTLTYDSADVDTNESSELIDFALALMKTDLLAQVETATEQQILLELNTLIPTLPVYLP